MQMAKEEPEEGTFTPAEMKRLQQAIGAFLWHGRVLDLTMSHALNTLASEQTKGNKETLEALGLLIDHCTNTSNSNCQISSQ